MLVQRPVLGGGDEGVGVAPPGDVGGHVPVLRERGEGNKRPLDVPDIDSKVYTERCDSLHDSLVTAYLYRARCCRDSPGARAAT